MARGPGFLALLGMTCLLVFGSTAQAHPLAPALLELREVSLARYTVLWRTSITRVQGSDVKPQLPANCRAVTPVQTSAEENQSLVLRWQVECASRGLAGQTLAVSGLDRSGINVILRLESRDGEVVTTLLDAGSPDYTVPLSETSSPVFGKYSRLGVEHLLLGLDHVLFVLGLLLLVRRLRLLVVTITAFTLGHSLTLALATLGVVQVNPALTELAIAFSIVVLALELARPRPQSLLRRRPWLMACAFGLLHGLGFAGALAEVGLPRGEIPLALLAFNLGIEAGQLLLVVTLLFSLSLWERVGVRDLLQRGLSPHPRPLPAGEVAVIAAAYVVGSLAGYWCIERAVVLFS